MALRFIIGRSGYGKTTQCMQEILALQPQRSGRQILIVPEQFTSQTERDLLAISPNKSMLHGEVLSFGRLAHQFFSLYGIGNQTPLGDIGKSMALQKVLLQKKKQLSYFQNIIQKNGFVDQLGLTISEFFQYQITPELLHKKLQEDLPKGVHEKITDLLQIYEGYLEFLENDYISGDETLSLFANGLTNKNVFADAEFWIDGFYGFTPQEISVIERMMLLAKNVTITLTMDQRNYNLTSLSPSAPFFEAYTTKNTILALAENKKIEVAPPVFLTINHRAKTECLRHLEENYFQGYYKKCALHENVQIFSCATKQEEIRFTAGRINHLIREKNIRYRDIAIVTNAIDDYEKSLRSMLDEYKIPYFIDSRREISNHPFITLVTSLLDILIYDFRYEHVFSYLKSGLLPFSHTEIDVLENYVLAYGIKSYKWHKETWTYGATQETEEMLVFINELHDKLMASFQPLLELKNKKIFTLNQFIELILAHINEQQINQTLSAWIGEAQQNGNLAKAEEHKQIWKILLEVFQKASDILGKETLSLEECGKILKAGLEKCTMGVIPPTLDCVLVGDIERSRLPQIQYLFVLGVNEGILPAPTLPQGLFTETERTLLVNGGMQLATGAKQKAFEEQFLIYCGLTKPSNGLYLTFANGDTEGKALFPSTLIDRLQRMDSDLTIQTPPEFSLNETSPIHAFHQLGGHMLTHGEKSTMDCVWQDIFSYFNSSKKWSAPLSLLKNSFGTTKKQELLSPKIAKTLYGKTILSSVSKLERFSACPFSFFVEYSLKAKERKLYQLHTPDLGTLFHEVLDLFSNKLSAENIPWQDVTYDDTKRLIGESVKEAAPKLGNEILLESAANQYLVRRLQRISTHAAWTLVKHLKCGEFSPVGYEIGFGYHDALPPIVIEMHDGTQLVLSGKIDRVDVLDQNGNHFVKIIDYKSGSKNFNFQDVFYGLQLQLLVYMDAYLKHYEQTETPYKPAGVFYFRITDPKLTISTEMSAEKIEETLYKKMQMSGLVLADEIVYKGLDNVFENGIAGVSSAIVPVSYTKKEEPASTAFLATEEEYKALLNFVGKRAAELGERMKNGEIAASPYRKGEITPCNYCRFKSICRYDCESEPSYRDLKKIDKKDFWDNI